MKSHPKTSKQINRHVLALITFISLVPLVYFIPDIIGRFLPAIKWLNVVAAVAIIVSIISYAVVPLAYVVFAGKRKIE